MREDEGVCAGDQFFTVEYDNVRSSRIKPDQARLIALAKLKQAASDKIAGVAVTGSRILQLGQFHPIVFSSLDTRPSYGIKLLKSLREETTP
jgi:hypothetical protein